MRMQEELNDYYRLLAVLEQELQITTQTQVAGGSNATAARPLSLLTQRSATANGPQQRDGASPEDTVSGTSGLTLLRLKAWLQEPIER